MCSCRECACLKCVLTLCALILLLIQIVGIVAMITVLMMMPTMMMMVTMMMIGPEVEHALKPGQPDVVVGVVDEDSKRDEQDMADFLADFDISSEENCEHGEEIESDNDGQDGHHGNVLVGAPKGKSQKKYAALKYITSCARSKTAGKTYRATLGFKVSLASNNSSRRIWTCVSHVIVLGSRNGL